MWVFLGYFYKPDGITIEGVDISKKDWILTELKYPAFSIEQKEYRLDDVYVVDLEPGKRLYFVYENFMDHYQILGRIDDLNTISDKVSYINNLQALADVNDIKGILGLAEGHFYAYLADQSFDLAYDYYKQASSMNHQDGHFFTGLFYYYGLEVVKQDIKKAIEYFLLAEKQGHPYASEYLFEIYLNDEKNINHPQAFKSILKAKKVKLPRIYNKIAYMYRNGLGTKKNTKQAIKYYQKSAKQGDLFSYGQLGDIYSHGELNGKTNIAVAMKYYDYLQSKGIPEGYEKTGDIYMENLKEYRKAYDLYLKAYKMGSKERLTHLGYIHRKKLIYEANFKDAYEFFNEARELHEDSVAYTHLAYMYELGEHVEVDKEKSLEYFNKAADLKEPYSVFELAFRYRYNTENPDMEKVYKDFKYASDNLIPDAQYELGKMYQFGNHVEKDHVEAFSLYVKASIQGQTDAMWRVALFYKRGEIVKKDEKRAYELLRDATALNNPRAINSFGKLYHDGVYVKQDYKLALMYYDKAIDLGNTTALRNKAVLYIYGLLGERDVLKGIKLLEEAIEKNDPMAKEHLNLVKDELNLD